MAIQKHVLDARRKFLKRRFEIEPVRVRTEFERALEDRGPGPGPKPTVEERPRPVVDNLRRIKIIFRPEAVAGRTSAIRRIEAEGARLQHRNGNAAIRAREFFGEGVLFASDN